MNDDHRGGGEEGEEVLPTHTPVGGLSLGMGQTGKESMSSGKSRTSKRSKNSRRNKKNSRSRRNRMSE